MREIAARVEGDDHELGEMGRRWRGGGGWACAVVGMEMNDVFYLAVDNVVLNMSDGVVEPDLAAFNGGRMLTTGDKTVGPDLAALLNSGRRFAGRWGSGSVLMRAVTIHVTIDVPIDVTIDVSSSFHLPLILLLVSHHLLSLGQLGLHVFPLGTSNIAVLPLNSNHLLMVGRTGQSPSQIALT